VATADKEYAPVTTSGSFGVSGASVGEAVAFNRGTYTVTFTETGLPNGTTWYVNGTAWGSLSATVAGTFGTSVSADLTNGTYPFTVTSANKTWAPAYTSPFVVNGGPVAVSVTFTEVTYAVTFTEAGLPSGTHWSVTLCGTQHTSTTNIITFTEPNGTYPYTITDISGSHQTTLPYTGEVTVAGAAVTEPTLVFTQMTYSVTFTESGLPSGTEWWVNLTNGQAFNSTTNSVPTSEPNGTYTYMVATTDKSYQSAGGAFMVNGAPVGESVMFSLAMYTVTFTETGLPNGTTWYVNGTAWGSLSATVAGILGSSVSANLTNGTYSFTVASANKTWAPAYTSPFVVNGAPVPVPVTFTAVTYAVTFTESGLPSGTTWYVNLTDGQSNSSTGSMIGFSEPNGSYSYTVATADKEYAPTLAGGSFEVSGAPASESVTFNLVTYPVTFTETGLPSGTEWWVNVTGQPSQSSGTTTIPLILSNGTYTYAIATTDKSYQSPGGTLTVGGPVASKSVTFSRVTCNVTFTETGLPSGTEWWVNLTNGQSFSSTGTTLTISEVNGTYSYSASAPEHTNTTGVLTVSGPTAAPVVVSFSSSSSSSSSLPTLGYVIIGAVVVVVAIGLVVVLMRRRGKAPPVP
jgi:hypothetical protein